MSIAKDKRQRHVKERLDYSCALFDAEGGLVANAPHLPVHLGSMSTCVRMQAQIWQDKLKPGDVLVSNHPEYGGTHLPDITVIQPAFSQGKIVFFMLPPGHTMVGLNFQYNEIFSNQFPADIGGIVPGSMPPHSKELYQEGATIKSEKLVSEGKFNEKRTTELLYAEPAQYPNRSGTRCQADNLNDLNAQIAANNEGINLIGTLIEEYGEDVVLYYMHKIQENPELSVRNLLKEVGTNFAGRDLSAIDHMDDGGLIQLNISIDADKGEAIFDFEGTGSQVYDKDDSYLS
jgi:5-oxoprolinase (ATP-hydrolysing)